MWTVILIILALVYALNPFDILPDLMVGWGWLDDIVILGLLFRYLHAQKKKRAAADKYYQSQRPGENNGRANAHGEQAFRFGTEKGAGTWNPYNILEIDRSASAQDIRRAYRRLAGKYHPDKVSHLGEEFKALAEKRFKDIQKAYEELKRE